MQRLLNYFSPEDAEWPPWHVGGRYEVMRPVDLIHRTDSPGNVLKLTPQTIVLVMAVRVVQDDAEEVIIGYLADTNIDPKRNDGRPLCGWGQLWHPKDGPKLGRRAPQSWETGGCYKVDGKPVLRVGADLETDALCELDEPNEVLLLDLALAVTKSNSEPRLRGKVRTDGGLLGWLTIELPGAPPLLHRVNLLRKDALLGQISPFPVPVCLDMAVCKESARRSSRRAPVVGPSDYPWDIGGVYRTLEKVRFDEGIVLRAGKLVRVVAIRPFAAESRVDQEQLRLHLRVETGTMAGRSGWITTSSSIRKAALDVRNHLEFQQVIEAAAVEPPSEAFTVRIERCGRALGLHLRGLHIDTILPEGAFHEWNQASTAQKVKPGDRIIGVNGLDDRSIETLISEMKEKEILYVRILQDAGARPQAAGAEEELRKGPDLAMLRCDSETVLKEEEAEARSELEEQWRSEKKSLATPSFIVGKDSARAKIRITEDEPDWKPFCEGEGVPLEDAHDKCPCREQCKEHCHEEGFLSFLSCGPRVSRGLVEPAPEPGSS